MVKRMGTITNLTTANGVQLRIGDIIRWGRNKHSWYILVEDDQSILGWIENRLWAMHYVGNSVHNPELLENVHEWRNND